MAQPTALHPRQQPAHWRLCLLPRVAALPCWDAVEVGLTTQIRSLRRMNTRPRVQQDRRPKHGLATSVSGLPWAQAKHGTKLCLWRPRWEEPQGPQGTHHCPPHSAPVCHTPQRNPVAKHHSVEVRLHAPDHRQVHKTSQVWGAPGGSGPNMQTAVSQPHHPLLGIISFQFICVNNFFHIHFYY